MNYKQMVIYFIKLLERVIKKYTVTFKTIYVTFGCYIFHLFNSFSWNFLKLGHQN